MEKQEKPKLYTFEVADKSVHIYEHDDVDDDLALGSQAFGLLVGTLIGFGSTEICFYLSLILSSVFPTYFPIIGSAFWAISVFVTMIVFVIVYRKWSKRHSK